jgi:hypothetical protein
MKPARPRLGFSRAALCATVVSSTVFAGGTVDPRALHAAEIRETSLVTVAPGGLDAPSLAASRCPTFLWGTGGRSERLELAVYRVVEDKGGETALETTLRVPLDGRAPGWTPSLPQCLDRGGRYAWSVREADDDAVEAWAPVRWFEVPAEPSAEEIESVLAHLALGRDREVTAALRSGQIAAVAGAELPARGRTPLERTARAILGSGRFSVSGSGDLGVAGDLTFADDKSHVLEVGRPVGSEGDGQDLTIRAGDGNGTALFGGAGGDLTIEAGASDGFYDFEPAGDLVLRGGTSREGSLPAFGGGAIKLEAGGDGGAFQTVLTLLPGRLALLAAGGYLRFVGSVSPPRTCVSGIRGSVFYDTSKQDLCLCNDSDTWVGVTKAGTCN